MAELLNCEAVHSALPAYLAGELPPEVHYAVDTHLGACAACAAREAEERELNHVLRTAMPEDPAAAARLEGTVRDRIDHPVSQEAPQRALRPGFWRWKMNWALSSAFAVLLLATALYLPQILKIRNAHLMCREAVEDHQQEVIEGAPRKWRVTDADVQALVTRLGESVPPKKIGRLTFERARICTLGGQNFIHAVYSSGRTEYSVFIAPVEKASTAQVMPANLVRAERISNTAVAEYHSNAHTLIVAGDSQVGDLLEVSQQLAATM
jgi:hypothetical protein